MKLKIEELLDIKGVEYRLIKLTQEAYTVDDVKKYSNGDVNPKEICKTIILRGRKSGNKIAILLRGYDKLNFKEIKKLLGEEMAIASEEQVKEVSGVEPGVVCPFLLNVSLLVDEKVLILDRINCGSGDHLHGLEFRSNDFGKAMDYKIVNLAQTV